MGEKVLYLEVEGLYNTWLFFTDVVVNDYGISLWYNNVLLLESALNGYKMVRDYRNELEGYKLVREVI